MRNKKLYNYLVNTYGISRESIMSHISFRTDQLESEIKKYLINQIDQKLDSEFFKNAFTSMVADFIDQGKVVRDSWYSKKIRINQLIDSHVRQIVKDELDKKFKIDIQLIRK